MLCRWILQIKKTINRITLQTVYAERANDKELLNVRVKSGGKNRIH